MTLLFNDTFTGTGLLSNHTPDLPIGQSVWTASGNSLGLSGGMAIADPQYSSGCLYGTTSDEILSKRDLTYTLDIAEASSTSTSDRLYFTIYAGSATVQFRIYPSSGAYRADLLSSVIGASSPIDITSSVVGNAAFQAIITVNNTSVTCTLLGQTITLGAAYSGTVGLCGVLLALQGGLMLDRLQINDGTADVVVAHATGAVSVPMIVASASGSTNSTSPSTVGAALNVPAVSATAYGGANAGASLPAFSAYITAVTSTPAGANISLPSLQTSIRSGANAVLGLPSLNALSTATFYGWVQTSAVLPAPKASASGTPGAVGGSSVSLPMLSAAAQAGGTASASLPSLNSQSGSTSGIVASLAVVLPSLKAGLGGSLQSKASVAVILPMLQATNCGVVRVTLPVLQALASGYTVVAYTYEAYSINLKKTREGQPNEVTHYTNFPFTQILRYRNAYYGVAADGLYLLGGDTDAGQPIASDWRTHLTDFGSFKLKTPEALYVGGRIGPTATATAVVGESGDQAYSYATPRTGAQNYRIKLGKGLKSRYYGFGLADQDGGVMDIDTLDIPIDGMSRGI